MKTVVERVRVHRALRPLSELLRECIQASGQRWHLPQSETRGQDRDKVCFLIILCALENGKKEFVPIRDGHRESLSSCMDLLLDYKRTGPHRKAPRS
jgi:hypothetical protein